MFGLFKKKKIEPEVTLFAVANGEVVAITEVSDPVFSQKMMGDGYAVLPTDGQVTSPVAGKVVNVFPTKHAIGIKTENGLEILLHMGLDTVELNGEPFDVHVKEGDRVDEYTLLATVDLEAIKAAGKDTPLVVVVTNMDQVADLRLNPGIVVAQNAIGVATVH